jgi:hypothetical protein
MEKMKSQSGQGLTEYLILLVLVGVVCVGVSKSLGKVVRGKLEDAKNHIRNEVTFTDDR